ncbi:MAG TPA: carboxypeptidase-like regulatory domain-containing protein [Solirubrobacterales bacterium]|jgi:hypothetical protein|nr:carboxypeptidase-like regulatory domain-containing protein [Solirubrobacterales bacterium]
MRLPTTSLRSFASLAGILGALLIGLASPGTAAAGEYTISICQADEAGYVSSAFENFATRGMKWRRACNPLGPGLRGLVTANVPGTGKVPRGAQSGFVLSAPPGTAISRLRWSGVAHRRDCRYALQLYAERPGESPISIKNVRANRHCPNPEAAQASNWPRLRAYDLGGATRIVQRVVCVGNSSREYCSARGQNYIGTLAAEATVVDSSAPSAGVVQDEPLAQGKWVSGRQGVRYEAADNVGIKSASVLIGGAVRGSDPKSCSYSQRIPCPNSPGWIGINTAEAPEGSQPLTVVAEDAAANRAESAAVTARIDNAAPGAVSVGVGGGEAWRNSNDFDVAWSNPPEPDRAPITAAHYRLCHVGGNECSTADSGGEGIAAIDSVKVPSPGEWELRLWREDAAGNQQPANASQPVRLRFDPEPPQLGFETPSADDPTRISVLATDHVSGVGGGEIEISLAGSGTWQVLPTAKEGDHLVTRVNDAALPAGEYELRASASDLANNIGATDHRLDGQPMRLRLPLRTTTAMKAGVIDKRTVNRKGKKGKVRRTVLEPRVKVSFGRRVRLGGRLVNSAGHPLPGAKVLVYAQLVEGKEPVDGTEELEDTVTTNADGRFVYPVEARSSHQFRFVYEGTATIFPIEDQAILRVKATSTFSVTPDHILNGESVTFSGRVRGRPLPANGKLIELEYEYAPHEWQTFRTVRSDPTDGTWSKVYFFRRTCGVVRYPLRVHLPSEGGYPLVPGNSRELTVRVRGRPC